jgi:hypothetical protein
MLLNTVGQLLALLNGIRKLLENAQRLLESLWAILKVYRKASGKAQIPQSTSRRGGRIASGYWQRHGNFCLSPMKRCISVHINKKSKTL